MHQDFRHYDMPVTAARLRVSRERIGEDRLWSGVRPARERAGLEPARSQYGYTAAVDGAAAGTLHAIELEPGLAFVAWVGVSPAFRRQGVAEALHRRVIEDFGALAVEDFASEAELWLLASLARRGLRLGVRADVGDLELYRHCRLVERMYTLSRGP